MKPITKKLLIIFTCFAGAGILFTGAGFLAGGRPGFQITKDGLRSASSGEEAYILEKTELDYFTNIDLNIRSEADIELLPSGDGKFYLEYTLDGSYDEPAYDVSDGTLTLTQEDNTINGIYFFGPGSFITETAPCIRIYIPDSLTLSGLDVYNDYGDLTVNGISAERALLRLGYGDLDMTDSRFTDAEIELSDGNLEAAAVSADTLKLTNEYGDSILEQTAVSDAEITIEDGGLTLDAYGLKTLSGVNEYGDTMLTLHDPYNTYSYDLVTEYGKILLPESAEGKLTTDEYSDEMSYQAEAGGSKKIEFTAEDGDIEVKSDLSQ